jgi:predicted  nucleic acid-binding Zn-ribbon protein
MFKNIKRPQNKAKEVSQKEKFEDLLNKFEKLQAGSKNKIDKIQELMSRKSSQKWDESKKKKMKDRLEQATLEYRQSFEIIGQIKDQLSVMS